MPNRSSLGEFFRETLYRSVSTSDAPLVKLQLVGYLPRHDEYVVGRPELDACGAEAAHTYARQSQLPPPCLCRYVTQPWRQPGHITGAPTALHMRTGFADSSDAVTWNVSTDRAASSRWIRAACGADPFRDGRERYLLTDGPGIALALHARYAHLRTGGAVHNYSGRAIGQTRVATRTWKAPPEVTSAVYDDVVAAGWSSVLQVAPQRTAHRRELLKKRAFGRLHVSSFWVGVVARSMCLVRCEPRVPECPHFADVFIRDLPLIFSLKHAPVPSRRGWSEGPGQTSPLARLRAPTLQMQQAMSPVRHRAMLKQFLPEHPCKNASVVECLVSYTSALTPL